MTTLYPGSSNPWMRGKVTRRQFIGGTGKLVAVGIAASSVGGLLAACAPQAEEGAGRGMVVRTENYPTYEGTPKFKEGSLATRWVHSSDFSNKNPITHWCSDYPGICVTCYDRLVELDPYTLSPTPWLAKSWTIQDNVYEFELQDNVHFHDGVQMTADDVAYTLLAWRDDPDSYLASQYAKIDHIDIIDPLHLKVVLSEVWAPFLAYSCQECFVIPKHHFEQYDRLNDAPCTYEPIGTGPFKYMGSVAGEYYELNANRDYWGGSPPYHNGPYIETLIGKYYASPEVALAAFLAGELACLFPVRGEQIVPLENYDCWFYDSYGTCTEQVRFNFAQNPDQPIQNLFKDPLVRQAFQHAIDREGISKSVYGGRFDAVDGWVCHPWARYQGEPAYKYDPQVARQKLEAAGYTMGTDGMMKNADGHPLHVDCILTSTYQAPEYMTIVAENLRVIGVDCALQVMEMGALTERRNSGRFDLYGGRNWGYGYPDYAHLSQSHMTFEAGGMNFGNYVNTEMDRLWDQILATPETDKAAPLFQEVGKIYSEDLECLWLGIPHDLAAFQKNIKGHQPNPMYQDQDAAQWWMD